MTPVFTFILILYCVMLLLLLMGWYRTIGSKEKHARPAQGISVIVPCRNELENVEPLFRSLSQQQYPADNLEIIAIDDHSLDGTLEKMQELSGLLPNLRIIRLADGVDGKKLALTAGIDAAKHEIIVTSDADCVFAETWLQSIDNGFDRDEVKMLVGPVRISSNGSFFSQLQSLEFASLVGVTAATSGWGHSVMCNGANLSFRKSAFRKVRGYEGNLATASGDDEFLMRKIRAHYRNAIQFLATPQAIVSTCSASSVEVFFQQRIRWAGKWSQNSDGVAKLLAVFIFLAQLSFVWLLVQNIVSPDKTLRLIGVKILLEALFIFAVSQWLRQRFNTIIFLLLQVLYPLYAMGVAVLSWVMPFRWKGRNYR